MDGRRPLVVLGAMLALVVPSVAHAGDAPRSGEVIAETGDVTTVSAHGNAIAYSVQDERTERWRLVAGPLGEQRVLPIASRAIPFDVDLGPGHGMELTAVYSRCQVEPTMLSGRNYLVDFVTGSSRCRLYRYRFDLGREQLLKGLSRRAGSAFRPTIWRDRIAYAVDPTSDRATSRLFRADLQGRRRRALPRGRLDPAAQPVAMDLRGTKLAFAWYRERGGCPGAIFGENDREDSLFTDLYETAVGARRARRLVSTCSLGNPTRALGAAWNDGKPVTGIVSIDQSEAAKQAPFGLDVLRYDGSNPMRIGGFPQPDEQFPESLALTNDRIILSTRVITIQDRRFKIVARIVSFPIETP